MTMFREPRTDIAPGEFFKKHSKNFRGHKLAEPLSEKHLLVAMDAGTGNEFYLLQVPVINARGERSDIYIPFYTYFHDLGPLEEGFAEKLIEAALSGSAPKVLIGPRPDYEKIGLYWMNPHTDLLNPDKEPYIARNWTHYYMEDVRLIVRV